MSKIAIKPVEPKLLYYEVFCSQCGHLLKGDIPSGITMFILGCLMCDYEQKVDKDWLKQWQAKK